MYYSSYSYACMIACTCIPGLMLWQQEDDILYVEVYM